MSIEEVTKIFQEIDTREKKIKELRGELNTWYAKLGEWLDYANKQYNGGNHDNV